MFTFYPIRSLEKAVLLSLLLLCFTMHSGTANTITVVQNETLVNPTMCGCTHILFEVKSLYLTKVTIKSFTKGASFISLILNHNNKISPYAPLMISVEDFTMEKSYFCVHYPSSPGTVINFTRGTSIEFDPDYYRVHFSLSPVVSSDFTLYIRDFTSRFDSSAPGNAIVLGVYNQETVTQNVIRRKTGIYVSNVTVRNAKSVLVRGLPTQAIKDTGLLQHIGTISVTDTVCVNCIGSFYEDNSTNVIEYGLVRIQNCVNFGYKGIYTQSNGRPSLQLKADGNLIISNVSTNGPLFGDTAITDGTISSTSRLTLHQITAKSLYPTPTNNKLLSSVPSGAQVYLGPMKLAEHDVSSFKEYNDLNIPFTRVTDANRKVLFLPDGKARADVGDSSEVGDFSASHCVNDGYSSVGSDKVSSNSDVYEAKCMCNDDRFVPHCTTTWDPLGESLCPIGMSMSLTQKKCVSCSLLHCSRCDVADQCAECDKDYLPVEDKSECAYHLDHCKVISEKDKTKCAECDAGFSLTINGKCVATIPNCVSYNDDGDCLSCGAGLSPSSDGKVCVSCLLENCAQCDSSGNCRFCKDNYTLVDGECIECFIEGCVECYKPNVCGHCDVEVGGCVIGGEQDTSKSIPWWVWLIVGLAAAVVVGLIIFFVVWCCCCKQEEYFVTYQEKYNEAEEKNGNRDRRLWDRNGSMSGSEHGAVFMMNDNVRPRIFKQDENNTHGEGSSFASSDSSSSSSSTSSSRKSASSSSDSGSSTDSGRGGVPDDKLDF